MFQLTLKPSTAVLVTALLSACGGGSGGSGGNDPVGEATAAQASTSAVNLSWSMPQHRENGEPLATAEIQGCVIVAVKQQQLENPQTALLGLIPSQQTFNDQQQQLNRFINGSDIAAVINAGLPEAILIYSSEQTNYRFGDIDAGTYHFAVSCFDWDDLYSALSNTVTKTL